MFNSATIVTSANILLPCYVMHGSRSPSPGRVACRLPLCWTPVKYFRPNLPDRITQANAQQRLARVLEYVNDLALRIFEINAFSVGQQVIFRASAYRLGQSSAKFFLQKFHDAADPLQGESFAAKSADDRDFREVVKGIHSAPAFTMGLHNAALVPPLKLARRDAREFHYLR
jgi:hypothetical protein